MKKKRSQIYSTVRFMLFLIRSFSFFLLINYFKRVLIQVNFHDRHKQEKSRDCCKKMEKPVVKLTVSLPRGEERNVNTRNVKTNQSLRTTKKMITQVAVVLMSLA